MISIILPTYNERENIKKIVNEIFSIVKNNLEVIIVDDNSPDGTGVIAEELAKKYNIKVIHRPKRLGLSPSTKLLEMAVEPAYNVIADHLKIPQGVQIIRIKRLRLADNVPLGIQETHLPYDLCFDLLNKDFNKDSIFDSLRELGLFLASASQVLKASLPTKEEQKLLGIHAGDPVIRIEWSTYLEDGQPIEVAFQTYRGDKYQIESSGRI